MNTIPKLAHWIWFGENAPDWVAENINTFHTLHPEWDVRLWHELPTHFPENLRAIINSLPWYSSRSDIFRYWLLAEYGGVYFDTDILTLRNFNTLLHHDFFLAPCHPTGHTQPHLACALMGSTPGSKAAQKIINACNTRFALTDNVRRITYGPDLLTQTFQKHDNKQVSILPLHYFYAIPDHETAHAYWHSTPSGRRYIMDGYASQFTDSENPYAIHLWGVEGSSHRKVDV